MILVTGASGNVGGAVVAELRNAQRTFKALFRSRAEAAKAAGADVVIADFADRPGMKNALTGVDTVFLVCSPIPQLVELEGNVIDACVDAGVAHVVLHSALGAGDYDKSFPRWHRKVEDRLKATRLSHTILRPNGFFQNVVMYNAPSIRKEGAFYAAMGDAKVSHLDVADIATVAVKALERGAHAGKTYELRGPEALSNAELAARISHFVGRKVSFVDIPEAAQRSAMLDMKMPEWQVTALLELQQYYRQGGGAKTDGVLQSLLGRAPRTMDEFLAANVSAFKSE